MKSVGNALKIDILDLRNYLKEIGKEDIEPGDYAEILNGKLFMRNLKGDVYVPKKPFHINNKEVNTILHEQVLKTILNMQGDDVEVTVPLTKIAFSSQEAIEGFEDINDAENYEAINDNIKKCPHFAQAPQEITLGPGEIYCCKDTEEGEVKNIEECRECLEDRVEENDDSNI